ncbi:glycosyltransferase family 9 protein [Paraburkholderia sp. BCC1886]|uniref:glycosyltransferase family 9 protein n=1 Tax=Paraburkholderia sp. BCC1886 TaxID=2562670 RepID=UPI00118323D5|nr:glycosyltransferase family 9 protein [Paraburkholderia sp. BCC1886]
MTQLVQPASHVALILSPALGDSLLTMTIARNLRRDGIDVTVYGHHAARLRDWFPGVDIHDDLGNPGDAALAARLARFDLVIQMHGDRPFAGLQRLHPRVILLDAVHRGRSPESMATRMARFCRDELALSSADKSNGMSAPAGLVHRRHPQRVAIHPTASTVDKCWLASRYIRLAMKLRERGFDPQFVVAPEERGAWLHVERQGLTLPDLGSLDNVAAWLYESGWFIGNDSGIGHLASSLQIPTLSLFMRRGLAHTWRPGWGRGQVLIGSTYLPTGHLKERYWKYMLSVRKVTHAFEQLCADLA